MAIKEKHDLKRCGCKGFPFHATCSCGYWQTHTKFAVMVRCHDEEDKPADVNPCRN